jgi:hypothetical protein
MRQQVYIQQHFRRGNAASHPDCRATRLLGKKKSSRLKALGVALRVGIQALACDLDIGLIDPPRRIRVALISRHGQR